MKSAIENKRMHKSFIEFNAEEMQEQLQTLQLKKHPLSTPIEKLCAVCTENYVRFYTKSIFTCGHKQMCLQCIHQWCSHSITQNNKPKCVNEKCSGTINIKDSQVMLTLTTALRKNLLQIYKDLRDNKKCTRPDCFGFINNGTCELCLNVFCENCWNPQHRGDCKTSQIQLPDGIKVCPKCGQGIQKDGGCLHMICGSCKYNFCYKCLQSWSKKHHFTCGTGDKSLWEMIFG